MITVTVYEADGTTRITEISGYTAVKWLDELDGQGSGELTVPVTAPELTAYPALLDYRNVVKLAVDGTDVGAWLVTRHSWDTTAVPATVTVSGPGLLAWLDDAVVFAEFDDPQAAATRWFNWGSMDADWFRGSEWTGVVDMLAVDDTDGTKLEGLPANWPDLDGGPVKWVWDSATAYESADPAIMYFRHKIVVDEPTSCTLFMTGKNRFFAMLDGQPLMNIRERRAWTRTYEVDFDLSAGEHLLGIRVRNLGSWAGMICAVAAYSDRDADDDTGTLLVNSGSIEWAGGIFETEPGWTAGLVLSTLKDEAVARGVSSLGNLTRSFTINDDSGGTPWSEYTWQFPVGDSYTAVVEAMRDFDVQTAVTPDLQWHAWTVRGSDKPDVVVDRVAHATTLTETVEVALRNALLVSGVDEWSTEQDSASVAAWGRIEGYLDVSQLPDRSAAKVVDAVLTKAGIPVQGVSVEYTPGAGNLPWVDYSPGDTIRVAGHDGGYTPRKVWSIAVEAGGDGREKYTVELDAISRDQLDRLQRIIDGGDTPLGTLGGRTPKKNRGHGGGNTRTSGGGITTNSQGVTGYRQPRAKVDTADPGGTVGGSGWEGVLTASHATAAAAITSLGWAPTVAGSTSSVDTTIDLTGTAMQRLSRLVRKTSGNFGGVYAPTTGKWVNTVRGFHVRFLFGTVGYNSATALYAGLFNTAPAAEFTTFTGWASVYAVGLYKANGGDTLSWVWRTDAGTTGSDDTGLSWRDGEEYTLELDCEPAAASFTARVSNTAGEDVTKTLTAGQFPDATGDSAALLGPCLLVGTGSTTTQLAMHTIDVIEPW